MNFKFLSSLSVALGLLFSIQTFSQQALDLETCQQLARAHYPLLKQQELSNSLSQLRQKNYEKQLLPQIVIHGQASYQSEVTSLPIQIPGIQVPELSRDQYRIFADLNQVIYDGGAVRSLKRIQDESTEADHLSQETELYKLIDRVNQVYFGLLLNENLLKQTQLMKEDLSASHTKMNALVKSGLNLRGNLQVMEAEQLKLEQKETELSSNRTALLSALAILIGKPVTETTKFQIPKPPADSNTKRPELMFLEKQQGLLMEQQSLLLSKNRPRINLFLQAGYGRPALNMLNNEFQPYYIGGLRLQWNISGLYTQNNEKQILKIGYQSLEVQKDVFSFNNRIQIEQQDQEQEKFKQMMLQDERIITLRESISRTIESQMLNGVLGASEYIREKNQEQQAREQKTLHEIQFLAAQYYGRYLAGQTLTQKSK